MQCPHCQAALTEKDRFCGNCGQPVAAPAAATAALPTAAIATPAEPTSTWSMPSWAWLLLGLAFFPLLLVMTYYIIRDTSRRASGRTL